tara:strand:+ start:1051 stop:1590 length:540 start_codon:yes stop_codon:yes gene_type:complete
MKHKISAKKLSDVLFEISKEKSLLDEVNKSMIEFNKVLKINRNLRRFMQSKRYSRDEKFSVLRETFGSSINEVVLAVSSYVGGVKANSIIDQIRKNFIEKYKNEKNIVSVHATLSSAISDKDIIAMQKQLSQNLKKEADLTVEIDRSLIGGAKFRIENKFLDASIKSQLKNIKLDLMKI